mgnify:FL=1
MSTIIEFIITFIVYFLVALAAMLPIAIFHTRKMEKLISNYFHEIDEIDAARLQSLKEVHAQVDKLAKPVDETSESTDELDKSIGEIHQSADRISESFDEIGESIDKMDESFDKMDERLDRIIEFKRLIRDYSNYKIKMIEARENFREPEFWDEKNIH